MMFFKILTVYGLIWSIVQYGGSTAILMGSFAPDHPLAASHCRPCYVVRATSLKVARGGSVRSTSAYQTMFHWLMSKEMYTDACLKTTEYIKGT